MGARVLMTGGATGIGAASAVRMAAQGADITILDVAEPVHGHGRFVPCDLSDPGGTQTRLIDSSQSPAALARAAMGRD